MDLFEYIESIMKKYKSVISYQAKKARIDYDDYYQEVWLKIIKGLDFLYKGEVSVNTYVYSNIKWTIGGNCSSDYRRAKKNEEKTGIYFDTLSLNKKVGSRNGEDKEFIDFIIDPNSCFYNNIESNQVDFQNKFEKGLFDISENQNQVLKLYYLEGLTMKEIGAIRGCSKQAVEVLLKKGVKKIKQYYEESE